MRSECVRARIVPEPCGSCRGCEHKRNEMITPLVHALREAGRIVNEDYLRSMPIQSLTQMWADWTQPRYVW